MPYLASKKIEILKEVLLDTYIIILNSDCLGWHVMTPSVSSFQMHG